MPTRQTFSSPRFYYTFAPHEPALTVRPGAALEVVCPDSDNMLADGSLLTPAQRQPPGPTVQCEANPLAGPIRVETAGIGDALKIRIDGVVLDRDFGQTLIAPDHGLLPTTLLEKGTAAPGSPTVPRHLYRWGIDPSAGLATLANPLGTETLGVPLDPFVGCIGVCPERGEAVSSLLSGGHGGNMDLPLLRAETTVYLPVHCEGALLMLGDVHAAQGHGEIIGGGIETSGRVLITVDVVRGWDIDGLVLRSEDTLSATGVDGDLRVAVQQACARLLDWITTGTNLNRWDAYNLLSQCVTFTAGGLVFAPFTVAASVPIAALPGSVVDDLPG